MRSSLRITCSLLVYSLLNLGAGMGGERGDDVPNKIPNCGAIALYQLCQIEQNRASWETVCSRLGQPPKAGYSMKELRDAAQGLGMELSGVKLEMTTRPLDRPGVFFIKRGDEGHFLVIRPVGFTRKMVQVLDGVQTPEVIDASKLESLPGWTGLALLPKRSRWFNLTISTLAFMFVIFGASWIAIASRWSRSGWKRGSQR